jgi:hypothetical protein
MPPVRLLPNGLGYYAYAGNADRFARLFRETWESVPATDKRRITTHWRRDILPPLVELMDDWSGRPPCGMGNTSLLGRQLRFCAPTMDAASEPGARRHRTRTRARPAVGDREHLRPRNGGERDATARALAWLGLSRQPRRFIRLARVDACRLPAVARTTRRGNGVEHLALMT